MDAGLLAMLRAELVDDLAGRGYAGHTAEEIAALLNAPYEAEIAPAGIRDVPVAEIETYLRSHLLVGAWKRFVTNPPAEAPAQVVDGVSELLDILGSRNVRTIGMTDPTTAATVDAVLTAIVPFGLLTDAQRGELLALAQAPAVTEERHPRWVDLIIGIAGAANAATEADVQEAQA